ncbi:MAG: DUF5011 domain-containing protein [Ruminococcus sp.]|nr:DUF5011 domain-containing protein [Ruminococcus sp.]
MKLKPFLAVLAAAAAALTGCGNEITNDSSQLVSRSESETVTSSQSVTSASTTTTWAPSLAYNATSRTTAAKTTTTTTTSASSAAPAKTTTATTAPAPTTTARPKPAATAAAASAPAPSGPDKTKPVVFYGAYTITHLAGNSFDLNSYVSYGDDTDRNPKLTYSGYVNPNSPGRYNITAKVTDASGNSTSWGITVNVVNSYPSYPSSPASPRISFADFMKKYAGSSRRYGIDVSQWQGNIDFNAVKNAGCSFVFIRVGTKYSSYTLDPYFKTNLRNAKAAGLEVGVYLYTTDHSQAAARDSAKWVISQLGGTKLDLPVAFDWEELSNFQRFGASLNDINNAYAAFRSELAKSGYSAMIYGNPMTLNNLWSASNKSTSPIWLAHYVDNTNYSGSYGIWQQCYGRIPGISGDTDFNVMYTNKKYK